MSRVLYMFYLTWLCHMAQTGLKHSRSSYLGRGPVVCADDESVVVHVEDDVLSHDGQTDEGDVRHRLHVRRHPAAVALAVVVGAGGAEADSHCKKDSGVVVKTVARE